MEEILDRQGDKEGRSNEVSEEGEDVEIEGGTGNMSNNENASSEENSDEDEDEKGGGPINAILDLLQLAAPILEDLSDVRTERKRDFEIPNIAPPHHLVLNPFSLNPKPKLPTCSK